VCVTTLRSSALHCGRLSYLLLFIILLAGLQVKITESVILRYFILSGALTVLLVYLPYREMYLLQ